MPQDSPRWGATLAEWLWFSLELGETANLLPTVCNPAAMPSPLSEVKETSLGKVPGVYNGQRFAVGLPKWSEKQTTAAQIDTYSRSPDYGICLILGRATVTERYTFALDLDVEDVGRCAALRAVIARHAGALPCRARPGSGRVCLVGTSDRPVKKDTLRLAGGGADAGIVELLGLGQQIVVAGTHRKSRTRYFWEGGLPTEWPHVGWDVLQELWADLGRTAGGADGRAGAGSDAAVGGLVASGERRGGGAAGAGGTAAPDPVGEWLRERGWVRGSGRNGELLIYCPWREDHTTDSGETETIWMPPGDGYEQGHFKCLHAHCAKRTDDEFLAAVGWGQKVASDFPLIPIPTAGVEATPRAGDGQLPACWSEVGSSYFMARAKGTKKFKLANTADNLARAMATPGWWWRLAWDEFSDRAVISDWSGPNAGQWTACDEVALFDLRVALERCGFGPFAKEDYRQVRDALAKKNPVDVAQLWLAGLVWDGKPRVAAFLQAYMGAAPGEVNGSEGAVRARVLSLYLWTALAGRIMAPGCQADIVPILVGDQGVGKSRGLRAMVPDPRHYVSIDLGVRDADLFRLLREKVLAEVSELRGLHTKDLNAIKDLITRSEDEWTPKYKEHAKPYTRRYVLVGTTNEDEFLADPTGNRRFQPIRVGVVDRGAIEQDRDQLWAEARELWKRGGVAWRDVVLLGDAAQQEYLISDAIDETVEAWLAKEGWPERFSGLRGLLTFAGAAPGRLSKFEQGKFSQALGRLGYKSKAVREPDRVRKYWVRSNLKGLA